MLYRTDRSKFTRKAGFEGLLGLNALAGSNGGKFTGDAWFEGLKMMLGYWSEQIPRQG
jgi:hypothetical protein